MHHSHAQERAREVSPFPQRAWRRAIWIVLLFNLGFLVVAVGTNLISQDRIAERVRKAFADGELTDLDYRPGDTRRGRHQYNDCTVLQMLTNSDRSAIGRALGPWLYLRESAEEVCTTLRQRVTSQADGNDLSAQRYTRYWHGYLPASGVLLLLTELATVRSILRIGVYVSVALVLAAGFARRRFLPLAAPVALMGLFSWSLPTFGPGMTHAYGDATTMLGLALLIWFHRSLAPAHHMLVFAAGCGAVVCYFDMLTGALPTAGGLLFPTAYFVSRTENQTGSSASRHLRYATTSLLAFGLGAALTLAIHTTLVAAFVRPHELDLFWSNFQLYTRFVDDQSTNFGWLQAMGRLLQRGSILTSGSRPLWYALLVASAASWSLGGVLAWRSRRSLNRADLLALVIGAASVPIWVALLQTHTYMHAGFMARILITPLALGFAALTSQLCSWRAPATSRSTA